MAERELEQATGLHRVTSDKADVSETIGDHYMGRFDVAEYNLEEDNPAAAFAFDIRMDVAPRGAICASIFMTSRYVPPATTRKSP